jgi:hypothetical protein
MCIVFISILWCKVNYSIAYHSNVYNVLLKVWIKIRYCLELDDIIYSYFICYATDSIKSLDSVQNIRLLFIILYSLIK